MFKSIKTKIILTVMILFFIGVSIMTVISITQTRTSTEKNITTSSGELINEMGYSIENLLTQFENGLIQMSNSSTALDFIDPDEAENTDSLDQLVTELEQFLTLREDASSIYYALPSKHLTILPHVDLDADFDPTSRDWYEIATSDYNTAHWSLPYLDEATGGMVITVSKAVQDNGKLLGVLGVDIQLSTLTEKISTSEIGYDGFPVLLDTEGTAIAHPTSHGDNLMDRPFIAEMYEEGNERGAIHYKEDGIAKANIYSTIPKFGWKIGAFYEEANMYKIASDLQTSMVIAEITMLIVILIALYFVISHTVKPIIKLKSLMNSVSNGDLTVRSDIKTKDEVGELGNGFNIMVENMNEIISVVNSSASDVRASSESLSAVSEETSASSEEVAHAVNEIAHGASKSAEDAEVVSTLR